MVRVISVGRLIGEMRTRVSLLCRVVVSVWLKVRIFLVVATFSVMVWCSCLLGVDWRGWVMVGRFRVTCCRARLCSLMVRRLVVNSRMLNVVLLALVWVSAIWSMALWFSGWRMASVLQLMGIYKAVGLQLGTSVTV